MFLIAELSAVGLYEWRGGSRQQERYSSPVDPRTPYPVTAVTPSPPTKTKLNLGFEPTQVLSGWPYKTLRDRIMWILNNIG